MTEIVFLLLIWFVYSVVLGVMFIPLYEDFKEKIRLRGKIVLGAMFFPACVFAALLYVTATVLDKLIGLLRPLIKSFFLKEQSD